MKVDIEGITRFNSPINILDLKKMDESLFDYDYQIYLKNFNSENDISTLNYKVLVKAVEYYGGDIDKLFEKYKKHTPDIMTHEKRYINAMDAIYFHDCAREILYEKGVVFSMGSAKNPRFHKELGQVAAKYQSMGKTLDFLAHFLPIKQLYSDAPKYSRYFNNTELYKCVYNKKNTAIWIHKYFENYRNSYRFTQNFWSTGIASALSSVRGLKPAQSTIDYFLFDIIDTLKWDFSYLNLNFDDFIIKKEDNDGIIKREFFYKGIRFAIDAILEKKIISQDWKKIKGRKVLYDHEIFNNRPIDFNQYSNKDIKEGLRDKKLAKVTLITHDLIIADEVVFLKGEIFNAPYTRFTYYYPSQSVISSLKEKITSPIKKLINFDDILDAELESSRKEAMRANKEALIAKQEKEKVQKAFEEIQKQKSIIQNISDELRKERDSLEIKVNERTRELRKSNEKLKELDKLKTDFFANVSHEFRTPLTLIHSPLESILNGKYGDTMGKDNEIFISMRKNCKRLLNLINNLLDFSKIEAKKMELKLSGVDIVKFLRFIISSIESGIKSKDLSIEFIYTEKNYCASIDEDLFEKALLNLISNAVKFNKKNGSISINLVEDIQYIYISIADSGIGIPHHKLESIFERFSQVDSSATRKFEGTGIGLALAKEIVDLHGGTISVKSKLGQGSEFIIQIPKIESIESLEESELNSKNRQDENPGFLYADFIKEDANQKRFIKKLIKGDKKITILVVEDNNDMNRFLRDLIDERYNSIGANDGKEALKILKNERVDLVLSDVMMPNMDGYELTKAIRLDSMISDIPIILLTAKAETKMRIEGIEIGANDYIIKPFDPEELIARINSQLKFKLLRDELKEKINTLKKNKKSLTDITKVKIEKLNEYLEENYYEKISREKLSRELDLSPDHLSRMFKQYTGKKISEYVNGIRIKIASKELKETNKKIIDIAFDVGFENLKSFNRSFKKCKGMIPSEYRLNSKQYV